MEMDDQDKHLLAMIDARRPSSSNSNRTTGGGMRPKIKRKVTFSDPLTQQQPTTSISTTTIFHDKSFGNDVNHSSVLTDNAAFLAVENDQQQASDFTENTETKNSSANSSGTTNNYNDLSRNSQRSSSWSSQQQFGVPSFSRFSGGQAGSKYDFQSVEDLLKSDSSTLSSGAMASVSPPAREEVTQAFFNPQQQQSLETTTEDTDDKSERTSFLLGPWQMTRKEEILKATHGRSGFQHRDDDNLKLSTGLPTFSQQQDHKSIPTYPTTVDTAAATNQDVNFDGASTSINNRITFDNTAGTNSTKRHVSSNAAAGGAPSITTSTAFNSGAAPPAEKHAMSPSFGINNASLIDPSLMENLLGSLKTEIQETYRLTVAETSQSLCTSISEENAINREQILNTMERLDTMLKTIYNSIEKGNEQNQLEGQRLSILQEELRQERNYLSAERNQINKERRELEDLKRELERESTTRNSYLERKEDELNTRCHDIEKERIHIENQKTLLEQERIEVSELKESLKVEAADLRDQRIRIDMQDANLNDERRRIQHMAEEISYLSRKVALEKESAEEELSRARQMKEDVDTLILGISEKQKELATGYDDIQKKEQALRYSKMDLARQRVDFLKERVQQRNNQQQNNMLMM